MPLSVNLAFLALFTAASPGPPLGTLTGQVVDRSGAAIAGALVEITSEAVERSGLTDIAGGFRFVDLIPARYVLTVTRDGFREVQIRDIAVEAGEVIDVPVVVDLEGASQRVEVAGRRRAAPHEVSVTAEELRRRPSPGDPGGLLAMVPGAITDRLDPAGAESLTGVQFIFRGSRGIDSTWTIDGIPVTDRQTGRAPGFFDTESLAEVHLSAIGLDLARPGTGLGVHMIVRSGTQDLKGTVRGLYTGHHLQASPGGGPVDHTREAFEYGGEAGGPLRRGRAWFFAAGSHRTARVFRQASGLDEAALTPHTAKVDVLPAAGHRTNVLWLDHRERRWGLNPSALRATPDALQDQRPLYPDNPFHGLWKVEHAVNRGPISLAARYGYYGTGFEARSRGVGPATISAYTGETFGGTSSSRSLRPQHTLAAEASAFVSTRGLAHAVRAGGGWQRIDMQTLTRQPGDGVVGYENSTFDYRARVHREAAGHSRLTLAHAFVNDTLTFDRFAVDVGVRADVQGAAVVSSRPAANPVFPFLVPSLVVPDSRTQTWLDLSPRGSMAYALIPDGRLTVRTSIARLAAQQVMAVVVQTNAANQTGWIEYPWDDANADRLVQPSEVRTDLPHLAFDGVNPLDPTSAVALQRLDPEMTSRLATAWTTGLDGRFGRLSGSLSYHYARHTRWPGLRWDGLTTVDYLLASRRQVTLPDGSITEVPVYQPDPAAIHAAGGTRVFITDHDYFSTYRGFEASVAARGARWSVDVRGALHDSRGFYREAPATTGFGNPTRLDGSSGGSLTGPRDPLVNGGQVAPATVPGAGGARTFLNARWQMSAHASTRLPWGFEQALTLVGRDGYPSPYVLPQSLGLDGQRAVLVTPAIDTVRLDDLWTVDLRVSRTFRLGRSRVQLLGDLFNALDVRTPLARERNLRSPNFDRVTWRVSPRIGRLGVRAMF